MAKKKDKRVTLKIKKKPIIERIGRLFTGPTNIDAEREKLVKNPPHNRPNRLWVDIHNDSTEEILRKITEDVWYKGHYRLDTDPDTGDVRHIQVTKPHYSEIEKYPYKDDPTFKNVMSSEYIIQRNKTRQWIENVLKQNKEQLKLPQSESDYKIRLGLNKVADALSTKKIKISTSSLPTKVVNVLLQRLSKAGQSGIEKQFLKYKKDLHPEIRKALQLEFPVVKSDTVIPVKVSPKWKMVKGKHVTDPQTPETLSTRINQSYGDILQKEANRTDPNFKHLSKEAKKEYINFMNRQLIQKEKSDFSPKESGFSPKMKENLTKAELDKLNRHGLVDILEKTLNKKELKVKATPELKGDKSIIRKWLGKNLSLSSKVRKDYIQTRRLNVIKEELRKLNREEKAAGRLGDKQRIIIQGIKKPPRGK